MDIRLLATIIQGEAGEMGSIGMIAIAMSISCRMWQHGHDPDRIAREFYGRAEPGPEALIWAQFVVEHRLPDNDYYYVMGHKCDVVDQGFRRGDWVILNKEGTMGLHLYSIKHTPWEKDDES